jgi:toxin ParE1/3/4
MPRYRLTSNAQFDLIEIRRNTLIQWGSLQSKKYLSELRQAIVLLSNRPTIGKHRPDIAEGVFSLPHASHVIYYGLDLNQLVVFGILHKRMVPGNHLEGRETI